MVLLVLSVFTVGCEWLGITSPPEPDTKIEINTEGDVEVIVTDDDVTVGDDNGDIDIETNSGCCDDGDDDTLFNGRECFSVPSGQLIDCRECIEIGQDCTLDAPCEGCGEG